MYKRTTDKRPSKKCNSSQIAPLIGVIHTPFFKYVNLVQIPPKF